jgi:hypothetical protein
VQNVEHHRRAIEAFNAHDIDALITSFFDPSIEFQSAFAAVGGAIYHGHDGLRKWHIDLQDAWGEEIRIVPEAYFDLGEHTLASYVFRGRGRQSGAAVAMPNAQVCRWRDGLCVSLKVYASREDAFRDLGVSEADTMEPIAP